MLNHFLPRYKLINVSGLAPLGQVNLSDDVGGLWYLMHFPFLNLLLVGGKLLYDIMLVCHTSS